ncbi:hypothetical protein BGW94_2011 [Fibrobacter sp. NR9]|nr:hypothetical protein BGW94_2011 [Fibrobacter sp. NR9]
MWGEDWSMSYIIFENGEIADIENDGGQKDIALPIRCVKEVFSINE